MNVASVVLTTYSDDLRLSLCLEGYARQSSRAFEVIVVNDGGPRLRGVDETRSLVKSFRRFFPARYFYLEPETNAFRLAAARNIGLRHARGKCLIIADGDSVPHPQMVELMLNHYREDRITLGTRKRIPMSLVPLLQREDLPWLESLVHKNDERLLNWPERFLSLKDSAFSGSWELCWGCLFSAPLEKVRELGGFDTRFIGWGGEDQDMAERLVRGAGCRLFTLPQAVVYHLDHTQRPPAKRLHENLAAIRQNWTAVRNGGPLRRKWF